MMVRKLMLKLGPVLRDFIPPVMINALSSAMTHSGFYGNYRTWAEAVQASDGYDSEVILNKVKDSLLKVKNGEAVYERDSVLFDAIDYSWPLLAGLLWIAGQNNNRLNLVDFGGSLGSSYYQNRKFLTHLGEMKWNIVEQRNFVECGQKFFQDDKLKFYFSLDECLHEQKPDTVLLCSSIQYLERPYELLDRMKKDFRYILIDRTPFLSSEKKDRITVQKVPAQIYDASIPAWLFGLEAFKKFFANEFDLVAEFDSFTEKDPGRDSIHLKGFIFSRKE